MIKTPGLDKFVNGHKRHCPMVWKFCDREKVRCTCGYERALIELAELKRRAEIIQVELKLHAPEQPA